MVKMGRLFTISLPSPATIEKSLRIAHGSYHNHVHCSFTSIWKSNPIKRGHNYMDNTTTYQELAQTPTAQAVEKTTTAPHVVIVGGGFGGLQAAKALGKHPVQVTVIDHNNFHLFQPMLYQVATAGLSPSDIANPLRAVLEKQHNTGVLMAQVTGVDMNE